MRKENGGAGRWGGCGCLGKGGDEVCFLNCFFGFVLLFVCLWGLSVRCGGFFPFVGEWL